MRNGNFKGPRRLRLQQLPMYRACDVTLYVGRLREGASFVWEEVDLQKIAGNSPLLLVANDEKAAA